MKFASARTLVALFAYLEKIGVSPRDVASTAAVTFVKGAAVSDRIPLRLAIDILERCASRLDDPLFGLKYAQGLDPHTLGPISLFWRYAPTLRYNHRFSARIIHMHYEGFSVALEVDGDEARFIQRMDPELRQQGRQFVETNLSFSLRVSRWILGPAWSPRRIAFSHDVPCDPQLYEDVLDAAVRFGAPEDALVARTEDLDRKLAGHDPELLDFVERSLIAVAERQPLQFRERLDRCIDDLLALQNPRLEAVAAAMGMSMRTLQRRLTEDGTNFQALLRERRRRIIETADMGPFRPTLARLAERTGFSDASAVSRFIRVARVSPTERRT